MIYYIIMANIIEILYRDYIWPYKRIMLIVFLLILFIIAGAYAYQWYAIPVITAPAYDDVANANRRQNTADLLFFYAKWCPHCKTSGETWAALTGTPNAFPYQSSTKQVNGRLVNLIAIDCTDTDDNTVQTKVNNYKIEHYPTVKLAVDDQIYDFEGSISEYSMNKFMTTIIQ